MRRSRAWFVVVAALVLALAFAGHARAAHPASVALALAHGALPSAAAPCAWALRARLHAAEAWAWSLCFDHPGACLPAFAAELSRLVRGGGPASATSSSAKRTSGSSPLAIMRSASSVTIARTASSRR